MKFPNSLSFSPYHFTSHPSSYPHLQFQFSRNILTPSVQVICWRDAVSSLCAETQLCSFIWSTRHTKLEYCFLPVIGGSKFDMASGFIQMLLCKTHKCWENQPQQQRRLCRKILLPRPRRLRPRDPWAMQLKLQ